MNKLKMVSCIFLISLTMACTGHPTISSIMLPTLEKGKNRWSSNGLVMVPEVFDNVTKPYIEEGYTIACPKGIAYEEFEETINKVTPFGTWMQWQAIVVCK